MLIEIFNAVVEYVINAVDAVANFVTTSSIVAK